MYRPPFYTNFRYSSIRCSGCLYKCIGHHSIQISGIVASGVAAVYIRCSVSVPRAMTSVKMAKSSKKVMVKIQNERVPRKHPLHEFQPVDVDIVGSQLYQNKIGCCDVLLSKEEMDPILTHVKHKSTPFSPIFKHVGGANDVKRHQWVIPLDLWEPNAIEEAGKKRMALDKNRIAIFKTMVGAIIFVLRRINKHYVIKRISFLKSDPDGVEQEAHRDFGVLEVEKEMAEHENCAAPASVMLPLMANSKLRTFAYSEGEISKHAGSLHTS